LLLFKDSASLKVFPSSSPFIFVICPREIVENMREEEEGRHRPSLIFVWEECLMM
jgi:hypothetical protein